MISKLRKKIIAINVISVCIVFFVAVMFLFAIGFNRIDNERHNRVVAAFDFDFVNEDFAEYKMFGDIMLIVYDKQADQIIYIGMGNDVHIETELFDEYINTALNARMDRGWLSLWRIKYDRLTSGNIVKIVISESYLRSSGIAPYIITGSGALLVGIASFWIISLMLASIALKPVEESWSKQRQFVADASHELKTPLSVIMANTEIIASHKDETVESQMKWIENTREESKRMASLIADLLFLAKHDDGHQAQFDAVDLSDCVETAALSYDAVFYENNKDFRSEISANVNVSGNVGQIKQLIAILLDNANKYSVGRGNIFMSLTSTGKKAVLAVSNDSEELSTENLSHLFDRFYTVDKSRNTDKGGNGLGLSIAKTICQNHGGDLNVAYGGGKITFTAEIPLYKVKKENNQ